MRLVSETKAWVSETGEEGFGNSPIMFGNCGSATAGVRRGFQKLWFRNSNVGFGNSQNEQGLLLKPTNETDKSSC